MPAKWINAVFFYASWVSCVAGGAQGFWWQGPLLVALVILTQVRAGWLKREIFAAAAIALLIGIGTEWALCRLGAYHISGRETCLAPLWIVLLWPNFIATLPLSMAWLKGSAPASVLLGAVGGPLSYYAGQKLGAIQIRENYGFLLLAIVWAVAVPLLVGVVEATASKESPTPASPRKRERT